jgi:hypothetical protein
MRPLASWRPAGAHVAQLGLHVARQLHARALRLQPLKHALVAGRGTTGGLSATMRSMSSSTKGKRACIPAGIGLCWKGEAAYPSPNPTVWHPHLAYPTHVTRLEGDKLVGGAEEQQGGLAPGAEAVVHLPEQRGEVHPPHDGGDGGGGSRVLLVRGCTCSGRGQQEGESSRGGVHARARNRSFRHKEIRAAVSNLHAVMPYRAARRSPHRRMPVHRGTPWRRGPLPR